MFWYESFRLCNHFSIVLLSLCLSLLPKYKVYMITWIWTLLFDAVIHGPSGPTSSSQFEHSSIPATVKKLFNLNSNFLTKRDAWAGTFEKYFNLRNSPRKDCPGSHENSVMIIKWAIASWINCLLIIILWLKGVYLNKTGFTFSYSVNLYSYTYTTYRVGLFPYLGLLNQSTYFCQIVFWYNLEISVAMYRKTTRG